jgi:uncharacterized protein (TIGR02118 family)
MSPGNPVLEPPETALSRTYTKRLGILRRKPGMSLEAFRTHWLEVHAALCVKLPGLRRYSVNFVDRERFAHFPYDGFSELWFDSEDALRAALDSDEGRTLLADLPNFAGDIHPIVAVEHVMLA